MRLKTFPIDSGFLNRLNFFFIFSRFHIILCIPISPLAMTISYYNQFKHFTSAIFHRPDVKSSKILLSFVALPKISYNNSATEKRINCSSLPTIYDEKVLHRKKRKNFGSIKLVYFIYTNNIGN